MIKNLVFKGGGILGIAYAGAITELEKRGVLSTLEKVAGTSAGSIVAYLLSLKYTSREIDDIISNTDFRTFQDGINPFRILTSYGLYKGDICLKWLESLIVKKGLSKSATFRDLKYEGFLDLHVFATDLNTLSLKKFSFNDTPDAIVAEAIRASMSIPLFFNSFKFSNSKPDNHIYVDGGVMYNYPLTIFDTEIDNNETLGLFLGNLTSEITDNGLSFNHPIKMIKALVETVLGAQNTVLSTNAGDLKRTIVIDSLGISPINFNITTEEKINLFKSGQTSVLNYFK